MSTSFLHVPYDGPIRPVKLGGTGLPFRKVTSIGVFNELILVRVAAFGEGLEDLREKKGPDGWQRSCSKGSEEGNPGDHPGRAGFYFAAWLQLESACRTTNQLASFCARSQNRVNRFGSGCALGGKRTPMSGYRLGHRSW